MAPTTPRMIAVYEKFRQEYPGITDCEIAEKIKSVDSYLREAQDIARGGVKRWW